MSYIDQSEISQIKHPAMGGAAGGAMFISRDLFFKIGGIPEDFYGSWGGEDNAFWAKLVHTGHEISKFTSTIYHLYHSPTTPRVQDIQNKVKPMITWNSFQWDSYIAYVADSWGNVDPTSYNAPSPSYMAKTSPVKLTLVMLSWLRYNKLIITLERLLNTSTIPLNLVLRVQGNEKLTDAQRTQIRTIANKFYSNIVYFTEGNIGTCRARVDLMKRALNWYNTPYYNIADDDTYYTPNSLEATISYLDSNLDVGVAGTWYKDQCYTLDSPHSPKTLLTKPFTAPVQEVDSTGTATAIIRKEVFDLCSIDPYYVIGYWDLDFFLQARSIGWKVVMLKLFPEMKGINDWEGCAEYRSMRMNRKEIWRSRKYFRLKWGLERTV
jgi:GT2 family glycosyltransferase